MASNICQALRNGSVDSAEISRLVAELEASYPQVRTMRVGDKAGGVLRRSTVPTLTDSRCTVSKQPDLLPGGCGVVDACRFYLVPL